MKNIAVVGAGEVGSRHLQALAHCEFSVALFAVDPDVTSLKVAQERFKQMPNSENVTSIEFLESIQQLPKSLDLCVLSTSSDIRLKLLYELVEHTKVRYVIFEKVIFQSSSEFLEAKKIIRENGVSAWANFNKRMFPVYKQLKDLLDGTTIHFEVNGGNWGLACNSIHFIDLLSMYTGDLQYDLDFSKLDPIIHPSKRSGFIEFTGTIQGEFSSGHTFSFSSSIDKNVNFNQIIRSDNKTINFDENEGIVTVFDHVKNEKMLIPFEHIHQSKLTHKVAKELFEVGSCQLPSYEESMTLHLPFIQGCIHFLEKLNGESVFRCPIT
jgi:predicted dehydrogenase